VVVVLVLAGLAVLGAVVVLAMGRGGELAETHPDHPPLSLPPGHLMTGTQAALLRLPRGLWGYQVGVTDEALHRLAYAISERDARMAELERQIDALRRRLGEAPGASEPSDGEPRDPYGAYDPEIEPKLEPYGSGEAASWDADDPERDDGAIDMVKHPDDEDST
jgi:hypothetical protein